MYTWHTLTIGHLSRNKFWGEREDTFYRKPLATCTLLNGDTEHIVVDPSLPCNEMADALFNASGLRPEQITKVFTTHYHFDHHVSPELFTAAQWYMEARELQDLKTRWSEYHKIWAADSLDIVSRCKPVQGELCEGVRLVALPGHTQWLHGLLFDAPEGRVLATGDAVMTREFYRAGEAYFYGWDTGLAAHTVRVLRGSADVIIPGHGEAFRAKDYE